MAADDAGAPQDMDHQEVARRVAELTQRKHELWTMLGNEPDEASRNVLFDELSTNRFELARLTRIMKSGEAPRDPAMLHPPTGDDPDFDEPGPPEDPGAIAPLAAGSSADSSPGEGSQDHPSDGSAARTLDARETPPRGEAPNLLQPRAVPRRNGKPAPLQRAVSSRLVAVVAGLAAVVAIIAVSWLLLSRSGEPSTAADASSTTTVTVTPPQDENGAVDQIRAVLDGLGLTGVSVTERDGTVYLVGVVASEDERSAAIGASRALAGTAEVDATGVVSGVTEDEIRAATLLAAATAGYDRINVSVSAGVATLTGVTPEGGSAGLVDAIDAVDGVDQVIDLTEASDRAAALDTELKRITAVTPIVFASGQTDLNALQGRVLRSVAEIVRAYPGPRVTVVGYTDASGTTQANEQLSLIRAQNVRTYMITQGVPADRLVVEARGEASSSGSEAVAGLERRIEFEVGYSTAAASGEGAFRIGIVAPSARDDLAFTQSIVDAVNVIADERDGVVVDIVDGTFVPEDAAAAIRAYAADGYDLVIAHGSQYGTSLAEIAREFPDTAFAWGTAADTFGLPNVSAYEAASDQGGYVMGVVAALLTKSSIIGVVGPLEVGDAKLFVDGFRAGVRSTNRSASVPVTYTGSFSDVALAAEAAAAHIDAGADILTGTAQMVVGAVGVASENDALWFGTQSNQTALEPDLVVASQVYHWEVALRQILDGIEQGTLGGSSYSIDLANSGIIVEYNPGFLLPTEVRDTADSTVAGIISGTISTGV